VGNSKFYLAYYKPEFPMKGKRGGYLKWHPEKRKIHAMNDDMAVLLARHGCPGHGTLGKVEQGWYDQNNRWRTRRVL
jgi:hypothetical protein